MKKKKPQTRLAIFAAITLTIPFLIYFAAGLPLLYKIGIPGIAGISYILLTLKIFSIAKIPKGIWMTYWSLLAITIYLLIPNYVQIGFTDTNGQEIEGMIIADGQPFKRIAVIPRGTHDITYTAPYRQTKNYQMDSTWYPWIIIKTVQLEPGVFNYEQTKFWEPYKKKALKPQITVQGKDLDGREVNIEGSERTSIPYGTYNIRYDTRLFSLEENIKPGTPPEEKTLEPNENTIILGEKEAEWIKNYMREYVELSAQKIIRPGGWPKQIHLYKKNQTLSLGDMLFVLCQLNEEDRPVLYVPKEMQYRKEGKEECYSSMLDGKVPENVKGLKAEQAAYEALSDVTRTIESEFGELNQKKRALEWALSYDVEYGRYVPEIGITETTYSTCEIAPQYLTPEQCQDADYAGWVSSADKIWWYDEYDFPVSSGMIGWRWILQLGKDYGIPTTQYLVVKDIELFREKDPALFKLSKELTDDGLIEIASHTRYHTMLSAVNEETARTEMLESRKELEELYGTEIVGFRNPYLALVNGTIEATEQALAETSYTQYSLYGEPRETKIGEKTIIHKPINFFGYLGYAEPDYLDAAIRELPYVISLDHPWNIIFHEELTEQGTILKEAPEQPIQNLAIILEAMSKGVWFTTVEEIEVKSFK